jgi:1,4-dihydroxy-2-naphthoyl-CoA hydrolase
MSDSKPFDTSTPLGGWSQANDLTLVAVSDTEVIAELTISSKHHQPMGIVHGGVYCGIVETVCSVGGYMNASKHGNFVVGVDNHTSFLKATRAGILRAVARPLSVGRRTQLWEAEVRDESGALVATGRVRLISVEAGANLAGAPAANRPGT